MSSSTETTTAKKSLGNRFVQWIQDPLGSIVAASVATIGSLGFVLSGIWMVNLALN
jgi:hypothetical protein